MAKSIYVDVSALCRPYDDQSYMRINLETTAVNMIFTAVYYGVYAMIYSQIHFKEIAAVPDVTERFELRALLTIHGKPAKVNLEQARSFAESLVVKGLGIADAAHVAFANLAQADLISCDDKLIKKCQKMDLNIWVGTPVAFCEKEGMLWMSYDIDPKKNSLKKPPQF